MNWGSSKLPKALSRKNIAFETPPFAEITAAEITEFTGQSWRSQALDFPALPALGCWVKTTAELTEETVYGIVVSAARTPLDLMHQVQAWGLSLQQLRQEQPQIFAMIKAEFRVAIVGFYRDAQIHQQLPSSPPLLHQAITFCPFQEIQPFAHNPLFFLRSLLHVAGVPTDVVIAETLRGLCQLQNYDQAWLIQTGRQLNRLLKDDYDRLRGILDQIHP